MDSTPGPEQRPSREAFVAEMEGAFCAAGLVGAFDYEPLLGTLVHATGVGVDVHKLYESLRLVARRERVATLEKLARALVRGEQLPVTWAQARERLLPQVTSRLAVVLEGANRSKREDPPPRPLAQITPDWVFEVVVPTQDATMQIPAEVYGTWGVTPEQAVQAALENLARRSEGNWLVSPEAPGVYRSPWKDGHDVSRLLLPHVFGRVPLRGRPVAIAPVPSRLLFADSASEEGLFHLAVLGRRTVEREGFFHLLRPLRMGEDGESWEDWLPAPEHPAYPPLRLLRLLEEKRMYDAQCALHRKLVLRDAEVQVLPSLHLIQSAFGAQPLSVTVWKAEVPCPLPRADLVVFERDGCVLGCAPFEAVAGVLGGELDAAPTYPPRYAPVAFPEDWRLAEIGLRPWEGPLPGLPS